MMTPYLNKIIQTCSQIELQKLLLISVVFFSIWSSIYPNSLDKTGDFGIIWFVILYITGAYIKKYPVNIKTKNCVYGLLIYEIIMITIRYASIIISKILSIGFDVMVNAVLYKYNFPLVYIASILLILIVSNLKEIKNKNEKTIMYLAGITLDIYVIHENLFIRNFIWGQIA